MNKSTTAEKIKIKFSKFQFFFAIFGGDSVKQLNKFVWPKGVKFVTTVSLLENLSTPFF